MKHCRYNVAGLLTQKSMSSGNYGNLVAEMLATLMVGGSSAEELSWSEIDFLNHSFRHLYHRMQDTAQTSCMILERLL
jgi:hypothetical protein